MIRTSRAFALSALIAMAMLVASAHGQATWSRVLDSPYGSQLQECRKNWVPLSRQVAQNPKAIEDCMLYLLLALVPRLREPSGIPALQIPPIDPMVLPGATQISDAELFQGDLIDLNVFGVSQALDQQHVSISIDPANRVGTMKVRFTAPLIATGDYRVRINPGSLFGLTGRSLETTRQGRVRAVVNDVNAIITVSFAQGRDGELVATGAQSNFYASSNKMTFTPAGLLDAVASTFLNTALAPTEVGLRVLDELKPKINERLAQALGTALSGGWANLERV